MPIYHQFMTNLAIQRQSSTKRPIHNEICYKIQIHDESANPLPIRQFNPNPVPILLQSADLSPIQKCNAHIGPYYIPIQDQSINSIHQYNTNVNLPIRQRQSIVNPWGTFAQENMHFANLVPILDQSLTNPPFLDQSANRSPLHRYYTHLPISEESFNLRRI